MKISNSQRQLRGYRPMETTSAPKATAAEAFAGKEMKKLGYSLYVAVSPDKLECRCSYLPRQQGAMMTIDELRGFLAQAGIKEGIDEQAVETFAVDAAAGKGLSNVLLATGTPPGQGADAWLSYSVKPSIIVDHLIDEAADVDLHNVQNFINVMPNDEIGIIIPAEPGTPGRTITGATIPAIPGKPFSLKIGKNIRVEDNDTRLVADNAGRVCEVSGEISVEEEYVVSGDVNFRVGSINFNGVVEVRGDVLDDFTVHATKGLRISGNVGKCRISSEGDISLCGMDGQGQGTIVCGGSIRANFIHDCVIECSGDVIVEMELHNCTVKTLGRVIVNKGSLSGGACVALGGVETNKLGSPASVRTFVTVGVDYNDEVELEDLLAALAKNHEQVAAAASLSEIEQLRTAKAELTERVMAIRGKNDQRTNAKINVKKVLYENIRLCTGMTCQEIVEQRDGPLSIVENTIEGGLRFLGMTSLDVKATDIELAFIRERAKR